MGGYSSKAVVDARSRMFVLFAEIVPLLVRSSKIAVRVFWEEISPELLNRLAVRVRFPKEIICPVFAISVEVISVLFPEVIMPSF